MTRLFISLLLLVVVLPVADVFAGTDPGVSSPPSKDLGWTPSGPLAAEDEVPPGTAYLRDDGRWAKCEGPGTCLPSGGGEAAPSTRPPPVFGEGPESRVCLHRCGGFDSISTPRGGEESRTAKNRREMDEYRKAKVERDRKRRIKLILDGQCGNAVLSGEEKASCLMWHPSFRPGMSDQQIEQMAIADAIEQQRRIAANSYYMEYVKPGEDAYWEQRNKERQRAIYRCAGGLFCSIWIDSKYPPLVGEDPWYKRVFKKEVTKYEQQFLPQPIIDLKRVSGE